MVPRRALYLLLACAGPSLALFAASASCSSNHDALAASGGGGGAAASTGTGGAVTSTSSVVQATASTTTGMASTTSSGVGGADAGPPGPTTVTVVDGVNDYDAVRFCFTAYPSGADVQPWPAAATGLPFARGAVIDPLAASVPSDGDVRPIVIAGDLASTAGLGCNAILALATSVLLNDAGGAGGGSDGGGAGDPNAIIAVPLPVLPASVFTSGKSLLLVATGCLGGVTHTDPQQALACGMSYAPDMPSADLVALAMNQAVDATHVALQVVEAAPTMPTADVRITPGAAAAMEVQMVGSITYGEAAPVPPFTVFALADFGALSMIQVKTYFPNTMYATSTTIGSNILANGNVGVADFANGKGFSLVAVGGYPGVPAGPWWHALTYALIRNDP